MALVFTEIIGLPEKEQEEALKRLQENESLVVIDGIEYHIPKIVKDLIDDLADQIKELSLGGTYATWNNKGN